MREMMTLEKEQELTEKILEGSRAGAYRPYLKWIDRPVNVAEVIVQKFLINAGLDSISNERRLLHAVNQKWAEFFPDICATLSSEDIEKVNSFLAKSDEELATELANLFLEKSNWPALFSNKTMQRRIKIIREYWQKNYSGLERIPFVLWKQADVESMLETASIDRYDRSRKNQFLKMREVEEQVYMRLIEEFLSWANGHAKSEVSSADEEEFLSLDKLLDTPIRFKMKLLESVNLALRSLEKTGTRFR